MIHHNLDWDKLIPECTFQASRSSGAGGQHVNKVSSRVELRWDVYASDFFSEEQKQLIAEKLASRITRQGILILASEQSRSQHRNRQDCIVRFISLLQDALTPEKDRIPTRPTSASRRRRVENKKRRSVQKENRRKPDV